MSLAVQMCNALMMIWEDHDEALLHEVSDVFAPHIRIFHALDSRHVLHLFEDKSSLLVEKVGREHTLVINTADSLEELIELLYVAYHGDEGQLRYVLLSIAEESAKEAQV